jgi:hypothetical protein
MLQQLVRYRPLLCVPSETQNVWILPTYWDRCSPMLVENRQTSRTELRYIAWIDVGDGLPMRKCIVREISLNGAKLGIMTSTPDALPNAFTLQLSSDDRIRYLCRVVWRSDENMGVEFLHPADPALVPGR